MKVLYYTTRDYVVQTVFTKERFDIKYALAEAETDKTFNVELLK